MKPLLNWCRRRNLESGLERELRYHMDRRVSDLVQSGLSEADAQHIIFSVRGVADTSRLERIASEVMGQLR